MFQLMLKDKVCAEFELSGEGLLITLNALKVYGNMPINCKESNLLTWLEGRHATKHRRQLNDYLKNLGIHNVIGFLKLTHGISINDCYWVRENTENITWNDVSPYINDYDTVVQHLAFDGVGLFGVALESTSPEFGISGNFEKCWIREDNKIFMLKRGSEGFSNGGLEPYCEVLASQIFSRMRAGIPYKLVKYRNKIASKCKLFNNEQRSFLTYANVTDSLDLSSMLQFYDSLGTDMFRRILICDAITLNGDRHVNNHGVFYSTDTQEIIGMAPGYDYNLALCPYLTNDEFVDFPIFYKKARPIIGPSFIEVAREVLTPEIRRDLINLKGIQLELPFYTEEFTKERCDWLSTLVNTQISNILSSGDIIVPKFKVTKLSNSTKYRLKLGLTQEQWIADVPRLMKVFNVSSMQDLEEAIGKLL